MIETLTNLNRTQKTNLKAYFKALDNEAKERGANDDCIETLTHDEIFNYNRFKELYRIKGIRFKNFDNMTKEESIKYLKEHLKNYWLAYTEQTKNKIIDILKFECGDIKKIELSIDWVRSQTWGWNPTATGSIQTENGCFSLGTAKASGCGYCKKSTVYSEILNSSKAFKKMILLKVLNIKDLLNNKSVLPYPLKVNYWGISSNFAGCGVESLINILELCGFEYKNILDRESYFIATK